MDAAPITPETSALAAVVAVLRQYGIDATDANAATAIRAVLQQLALEQDRRKRALAALL